MTSVFFLLFRVSLAGGLLLAASTAAHAANTLLAKFGPHGATFHLTDVGEQDASLVYGLLPVPGQGIVLIVDSHGENAHWSTASRRDWLR